MQEFKSERDVRKSCLCLIKYGVPQGTVVIYQNFFPFQLSYDQ